MGPGDLPQSKAATWIAQVMLRRTCWAGPRRLKSEPCTTHLCRRGLFAVRSRINQQQYVSPAQHNTAEVGHSTICLCDATHSPSLRRCPPVQSISSILGKAPPNPTNASPGFGKMTKRSLSHTHTHTADKGPGSCRVSTAPDTIGDPTIF